MPPSRNTIIEQQLKDFCDELSSNTKAIEGLSREFMAFVKTMDPIMSLFYGSDSRNLLDTRIVLLEKTIKDMDKNFEYLESKLEECQKEHKPLSGKVSTLESNGKITKDDVNNIKLKMDSDEKDRRSNFKDVLMELLKWVLAIASAVLIAKLST